MIIFSGEEHKKSNLMILAVSRRIAQQVRLVGPISAAVRFATQLLTSKRHRRGDKTQATLCSFNWPWN